MTTSLQRFRLFVEHAIQPAANQGHGPLDLGELSSIVIDDGRLSLVAGRQPNTMLLEPIAGEPLVALTAPEGHAHLRVNGLPVGPVHVLAIKDVIELAGGEHVLHLTLFQQPYAGAALDEHAGRECPICLTPIGREDHVLVCVHCHAVMHLGQEATEDAGEQLECARATSLCPCCNQRLAREESYVYVPEL